MKLKISKGERIFNVFNYIFLSIVGFVAIYPLIYVFSASISSVDAVILGDVLLYPVEVTLDAYKQVLSDRTIWVGYANAIYLTVVGTAVNLIATISAAYPLSKKRLPLLVPFTWFFIITMWFQAGMIPTYLNFKDLSLLDTRMAIIIGFAMTPFNMILLRTFFASIPASMEEAAKVDGASEFYILRKIYLPLSKAGLATIGLFYGVSRWNGYFWNMVLLKSDSKIPLQVMLKKMIVEAKIAETIEGMDTTINYSVETLIYATIIISIIPMMMAYPFIQKYFQKGIMIGAVKA